VSLEAETGVNDNILGRHAGADGVETDNTATLVLLQERMEVVHHLAFWCVRTRLLDELI
jgi:hypothetical protein